MPNPTMLFALPKAAAPLLLQGGATTTTGNIQIPNDCNMIRVWGCGGGGGGGGGFNAATGGGGGGGGGGAGMVIGLDMPVTPGETLTYQLGAAGSGGAAGFSGTDGVQTLIQRAGFSLLSLAGGVAGLVGQATVGGAGGTGPGNLFAARGAGGANAAGGTIGPTTINAGQLAVMLAAPFFLGNPGGGGTYTGTTTAYNGGNSLSTIGNQVYGSPGSTGAVVGGGGGGVGGPCWPRIPPVSNSFSVVLPNGGNDGVAGTTPSVFGYGGGGGGRNAAGGSGGPAFLMVGFL